MEGGNIDIDALMGDFEKKLRELEAKMNTEFDVKIGDLNN